MTHWLTYLEFGDPRVVQHLDHRRPVARVLFKRLRDEAPRVVAHLGRTRVQRQTRERQQNTRAASSARTTAKQDSTDKRETASTCAVVSDRETAHVRTSTRVGNSK